MAKKFTEMRRREAYGFIYAAAEKWNKSMSAYDLERFVCNLAWKWNRANEDETAIDVYPIWQDDFNDGYQYGLGIDDEYIVFNDLQDAWEQHNRCLI